MMYIFKMGCEKGIKKTLKTEACLLLALNSFSGFILLCMVGHFSAKVMSD